MKPLLFAALTIILAGCELLFGPKEGDIYENLLTRDRIEIARVGTGDDLMTYYEDDREGWDEAFMIYGEGAPCADKILALSFKTFLEVPVHYYSTEGIAWVEEILSEKKYECEGDTGHLRLNRAHFNPFETLREEYRKVN